MAKTVTLEKLLLYLFNFQPRTSNRIVNSAKKVSELLPDELLERMTVLKNSNDEKVKSQISNILAGKAVQPYEDCAEYLFSGDNLGTAFNHIYGKWAERIKLSPEQARNLSDMLDKDENRDENSGELCTRLKNAFACRDVRALAVLTLLAITRDTGNHSSNRWKKLSEQIVKQNLLPRIEEDTKQVIEICTDAYKMFDAADAKQFKDKLAEAKKFLAQIHQDADPLKKGEVFAALGRIFFKKFNGFFPPVNCRYLNEHIAALYDEGILTADSLAKESLAKLAPINPKIEGLTDASQNWHELSALLRLATAFNFLRTAQDCFEAASAPERWYKVSEDYLTYLSELCRKDMTMFLSEFKTRAAETSAEKNRGMVTRFFDLLRIFKRQMTRTILSAA